MSVFVLQLDSTLVWPCKSSSHESHLPTPHTPGRDPLSSQLKTVNSHRGPDASGSHSLDCNAKALKRLFGYLKVACSANGRDD